MLVVTVGSRMSIEATICPRCESTCVVHLLKSAGIDQWICNQCSHQWDFASPEERALVPKHLTGGRIEQFIEEFLAIKVVTKVGRRIWYPKPHVDSWLAEQLQETNSANQRAKRDLALPLQAGRQGIQRYNRLGRHKTKHEGGSRPRVGTSSRTAGGPKAVTTDPGPGVQ